MKTFLSLSLFFTLLIFPLKAEEAGFKIKTMREVQSSDLIQVDGNWLKSPKRLSVSLRVQSDTPANSVIVKAYFYDNQKKMVHTYKAPNPIWTKTPRGIESVGLPETLEKGRDIDVYFALTDELKEKKWKSVLVVFGNKESVVVKARPASAIDVEFPEKAIATADQSSP